MFLHTDILSIPYKHRYESSHAFESILNTDDLLHGTIIITNPVGEAIYFSNKPTVIYEIIQRGYEKFLIKSIETLSAHYEFFWWKEANIINSSSTNSALAIMQHILGLSNGFVLVRNIDDFLILYSFATDTNAKISESNIVNKINTYFALGDKVYNQLQPIIKLYNNKFSPPYIHKFKPFSGATSPKRTHIENNINTKPTKNNVVVLPFVKKSN